MVQRSVHGATNKPVTNAIQTWGQRRDINTVQKRGYLDRLKTRFDIYCVRDTIGLSVTLLGVPGLRVTMFLVAKKKQFCSEAI